MIKLIENVEAKITEIAPIIELNAPKPRAVLIICDSIQTAQNVYELTNSLTEKAALQ